MTNVLSASRRRGFTLIELLIVIVVISILALIVIPRIAGASRKAKDATLKASLQTLRAALSQFAADCGGNPYGLTDLVLPNPGPTTAPTFSGAVKDDNGNTVTVPAGCYQGPYLMAQGGIAGGIPINPYTPLKGSPAVLDTTVADHWTYTANSGVVTAATPMSGNTFDGTPYTSL